MNQLFSIVDKHIVDLFVQKAEGSSYCSYRFLNTAPYFDSHRQLDSLFSHFLEKSADGFIIGEPFCKGEEVVLNSSTYETLVK